MRKTISAERRNGIRNKNQNFVGTRLQYKKTSTRLRMTDMHITPPYYYKKIIQRCDRIIPEFALPRVSVTQTFLWPKKRPHLKIASDEHSFECARLYGGTGCTRCNFETNSHFLGKLRFRHSRALCFRPIPSVISLTIVQQQHYLSITGSEFNTSSALNIE